MASAAAFLTHKFEMLFHILRIPLSCMHGDMTGMLTHRVVRLLEGYVQGARKRAVRVHAASKLSS